MLQSLLDLAIDVEWRLPVLGCKAHIVQIASGGPLTKPSRALAKLTTKPWTAADLSAHESTLLVGRPAGH